MGWVLAIAVGLGAAAAGEEGLEAQVLEAAGHALELAPGAPWTAAVLGDPGDIAGRPDALLITLDDRPSVYAGPSCAAGELPRVCASEGGAIHCSREALARLAALDAGRGHPSVPLLHALAHELGHLVSGEPGLPAEALQVALEGPPEQRVEVLVALLDRAVAASGAEAEANRYADILLAKRLKRPPYDTSAPEAHAAVLAAARSALAVDGTCMIDATPAAKPSERDIQRGARRLLCAASGDGGPVVLAAFEGSHPDWPSQIGALERTTGVRWAQRNTVAYYAAVAAALEAQREALGGHPPDCAPEAVAAYLDGFDDVPAVCPRMRAGLESGPWSPVARIPALATGDQLPLRGAAAAARVLESGRVGIVLGEARQVGLWTPGEPQAELIRVPCAPSWLAEDGDGLLVACADPAGVAEIRGGRVRLHRLRGVSLGGEVLDGAGVDASWLGRVDDRLWLTGRLTEDAGFGVALEGWGAPLGLPAWKGEGCEALLAEGETRWWRPDPAGELHGVSLGGSPILYRLSAAGQLLGREDPSAWEAYAWDLDLAAGPVLGCGPSFAQGRSICVDSEGSTFDPVPDPLDFDLELSTARSLEGTSPAGAVCDTASARYVLLHDVNGSDREAWVIRHDEGGTEEVLLRPSVARATLSCGAAGAVVVLSNPELSRITWLR